MNPSASAQPGRPGLTGAPGAPARETASDFRVDDHGVRAPAAEAGTWQVAFDGRVVLSLDLTPDPDGEHASAAWVGTTVFYLDGHSSVELRRDDRVVEIGEVAFGDARPGDRVRFVDAQGGPVVIDKWGLAQRPFSTRSPDVAAFLAERALEMCRIAREDAGIELWMAFGTLLGAMRGGKVIGHDSDIDLAFLGEGETPAELHGEMTRLRRALSAAGMMAVNKTGSFVTVLFTAPDGSLASIDVYTCFHFGGLLYETASARAPVPREAILPLGEAEFEGLLLPAPADPARLLEVSYGPGWRHPDPDFVHRPDHAVRSRFDGWFGNVMRRRRDWEAYWDHHQQPGRPSDFSAWVRSRVAPGALVVEVGIGRGDDAVAYAEAGLSCFGIDYARSGGRTIARRRDDFDRDRLSWTHGNLYDLRDAVSLAAQVARRSAAADRVLVARGLLESLRPQERDGFWVLVRMLGRGSRGCYLEIDESGHAGPARDGVWRFPVDRDEVRRRAAEAGAEVVQEVLVGPAASAVEGGTRWRMLLDWPGQSTTQETIP